MNEAPERVWFHPKTRELSESHCGCGSEIEFRRVDPPAAPKCPTCKSDDKDIRNLGCNGSYGILHDNCGTEPCPDAWHAPAPADERDKALVAELMSKHHLPLRFTDHLTSARNRELADDLLAALATVRAEERTQAFTDGIALIQKLICPAQFEGNWRNGYSHAQNDAFRALESARTGKVEE